PVATTPEQFRENLREAARLLAEAGWTVQDTGGRRVLANANGEPMVAEFLLASPPFERVVLFYVQNLKRLGIETRIRTVDSAQYQNRTDVFDFDIIVDSWPQSLSPGNE